MGIFSMNFTLKHEKNRVCERRNARRKFNRV